MADLSVNPFLLHNINFVMNEQFNTFYVFFFFLFFLQLSLTVEGKTYNFISLESDAEQVNFIITHIGVSLKTIFPSVSLE